MAKLEEEVCRSIKLTDDIRMSSLSLSDQLRLLFSKVSNDAVKELESIEKLNVDSMRKETALTNLIKNATSKLNYTKSGKVTLSVPSLFLPFYDKVTDKEHGMGQFYDFEKITKDVPYNVNYNFKMIISKKKG